MDWYLSAGLFFQSLLDDVSVGVRDRCAQRRQFTVDDRFQDFQVRPAAKRPLTREHLVEHDAEGKDIAARIERLAPKPAPETYKRSCRGISPGRVGHFRQVCREIEGVVFGKFFSARPKSASLA